ncbi:DeoR/GlpR transcriptional regulator [Humibacter sp. BT305]|nr:DeoR/GlpR transcriptional regulator [Humibacter sp. BT305]
MSTGRKDLSVHRSKTKGGTVDTFGRRARILETVQQTGYVTLTAMSTEYGVSPVTIHRDFEHLEREGQVERVRGGARLPAGERHEIRNDFTQRLDQNPERKRRIADVARGFVPDGGTVFCDSSTSVLALARALEKSPPMSLTVVTNSPALGYLIQSPALHIVVAPGELDQSLRCLLGGWTLDFLSSLSFSAAFISAAGITESGLRTTQRGLADVAEVVMARSQQTVALIDSTKFDTTAMIRLAEPSEVTVVTDDGLDQDIRARYETKGWSIRTE